MKKRVKFIINVAGLLLFIVILAIVGEELLKTEVSEGSVKIEDPAIHVEVFAARRGPIHKWLLGEGIAHPVRREFLNFGQSGKIASIALDEDGGELREGSRVKGPLPGEGFGQVIAQLDSREFEVNLDMLQAELEQARHNIVVAEANVMQAESDLRLAQADLRRVTRLSEAGTTINLYEQELAQARQAERVAEAEISEAESDFKLAKAELERARRFRKQGLSLQSYKEDLIQTEQNVEAAESTLEQAHNDFMLAEKNFKKSESLHKQGILSQMEFDREKAVLSNAEAALDTARANLQVARSQVKSARNDLEKARIEVPILETESANARYLSAEATLKTARANLESARSQINSAETRLAQAKIDVPVVEYESARANLLKAEAMLKTATANAQSAASQELIAEARLRQGRIQLEQTQIFAPFDGVIGALNIKRGEYVSAFTLDKSSERAMALSAHLLVYDPSEYEITMKLPAYIGTQLVPGMPALIVPGGGAFPEDIEKDTPSVDFSRSTLCVECQTGRSASNSTRSVERARDDAERRHENEDGPGDNFFAAGAIYSVSPSISAGARAVQVKLRSTEGAELLQDGMLTACAMIVEEKPDALLLPMNSLLFRQNKTYAFVVDPQTGSVQRRLLQSGIENTRFIEVLSGVEEGELVVTAGRHRLVDGSLVEIVNGKGGELK